MGFSFQIHFAGVMYSTKMFQWLIKTLSNVAIYPCIPKYDNFNKYFRVWYLCNVSLVTCCNLMLNPNMEFSKDDRTPTLKTCIERVWQLHCEFHFFRIICKGNHWFHCKSIWGKRNNHHTCLLQFSLCENLNFTYLSYRKHPSLMIIWLFTLVWQNYW